MRKVLILGRCSRSRYKLGQKPRIFNGLQGFAGLADGQELRYGLSEGLAQMHPHRGAGGGFPTEF
jgi:hypothetical protein